MCGKEVGKCMQLRLDRGNLFGHPDMSELVANVKGPSEWYCKDGQKCWYNGKQEKARTRRNLSSV